MRTHLTVVKQIMQWINAECRNLISCSALIGQQETHLAGKR